MPEEKGIKVDIKIMMHFFKLAHSIIKTYIPLLIISSIFKAALPFLNIIMPKFIIDELMGQQRLQVFVGLVLIVIVGNGILNLINRWLDTLVDIKNMEVVYGFDRIIGEKIMDMDFEKIEDPEVLDLKERAIFPIKNQGVLWRMAQGSVNALTQVITIIGLVAVISTLNPIVIILIVAIVLLNSFIFKKMQAMEYEFAKQNIPVNRKFGYFANLTSDFSMGKDIRLYNISPLIMDKIRNYWGTSIDIFKSMGKSVGKYQGVSAINLQVQMLGIYAYMVYRVLINSISIGDFTMYVNAASSFSQSITALVSAFIEFRQACRYLDEYLKFEQIKSNIKSGTKRIKEEDFDSFTIEFKNVFFKYPRAKDYVLKDVSITIKDKEKLSVVGLNGAGKTTFIKLLTRLYEPTKGEIHLNGVNIKEYDYEDYMKHFSVVFQDFKLLAFSIKENIALKDTSDIQDGEINFINKSLDKSGLHDDIKKLKKSIDTSIYKSFDKDGIEFSGGQAQKLAIARAVYKDAPIVVLDEPTAALDPLAEYEIYSHFNELIGDKTTIYISHRLSSCKFCDKIAVFHNGEILQIGTHEELLRDSETQYKQMYSAQAQYYV